MKKLIIGLLFIILFHSARSVLCMAKIEDKPSGYTESVISIDFSGNSISLFEEKLSDDLIMCIFEYCLDDENIFEYFVHALTTVKAIKIINHHFNTFTANLVGSVRRIAKIRFTRMLSKEDLSDLETRLTQVFKKARENKGLEEDKRINENDLMSEAAVLIIAGADHNNITLDCDGPSVHTLRTPILEFIARTNLCIKLIPILLVYKMNINVQDIIGNTALHLALDYGNENVVKVICDCGGRADIQNKSKRTAMHELIGQLTKSKKKPSAKKISKYLDILRVFLQVSDNTIQNEKGETIFDMLADYEGDNQNLRLLASVSDLNSVNLDSDIPNRLVSDFVKEFLRNLKG